MPLISASTRPYFSPAVSPLPAPPSRPKRETGADIPGPAWTLLPSKTGADAASANTLLAARLAQALEQGDTHLAVPEHSGLGEALEVYAQLINQPHTLAWFKSRGLATDTLTLHLHGVSGYVRRDGVPTATTFTTVDGSGWWQASVKLRAIRAVLDPHDRGLPYFNTGEARLSLPVVLTALGLAPPTTPEQTAALAKQLRTQGLAPTPGLSAALDGVKRLVGDLDERAWLAEFLQQQIQGLKDESPVDWSRQPVEVTPDSPLAREPHLDARQLLEHKGLGSPRTVGETRNVIQWLRTTLPPMPWLGDYSVELSADQQTRLIALGASLPDVSGVTADALRTGTARHLEDFLASPQARAFGEQLAGACNWQGARAPLIIAAITRRADPEATPGMVAGYALYQPANMGRSLNAVRRDVEAHLQQHKGLTPHMAVLAAHLLLARAAPEFLVQEVPDAVALGTPAWMELRLGCAMADMFAPGTSRAMNEEQVTALTTLAAIDPDQRTLMQLHGARILADWAVLNGVIEAHPQGRYDSDTLKKAAQAFSRQRAAASRAFKAVSTPLPSRRAFAVQELLKVFPGTSASQLTAMTVQIADPQQRRNLPLSEPRTRSLVETYMTGDLVPDRWVLTRDMPEPGRASAQNTPFAFQQRGVDDAPADKRQALDARIRRLPALDGLLDKAVTVHYRKLQMAYVTKLKLMLAQWPLAERQRLETGKVELFTLRTKTGKQQVWETDEHRAAVTGRQGVLMRVQHEQSITYYEVFANGRLIKHEHPDVTGALDAVVNDRTHAAQYKLLGEKYLRKGHSVPLDFKAYASGDEPAANPVSEHIIIERLGRSLPAQAGPAPAVPDSFQSDRVEFIACEIAENHFYETLPEMQAWAKATLPLETQRAATARQQDLLLSLIPFVGAYQDLAAGNIAKGLQGLALDIAGLAIGAGVQARALLRSSKVLASSPLPKVLGKWSASVGPLTPKVAWGAPSVMFSDAAFDFARQTALFASAAFNPVDGYPRMISAVSRGLGSVSTLLATGTTRLAKVMPHLLAAEEKMRCYLLVATGQVDPLAPVAHIKKPSPDHAGEGLRRVNG
ncbi:hypothetical protein ACW9H6_23985 [Pseudomonas sp. SDO528_S397]